MPLNEWISADGMLMRLTDGGIKHIHNTTQVGQLLAAAHRIGAGIDRRWAENMSNRSEWMMTDREAYFAWLSERGIERRGGVRRWKHPEDRD